MEGSELFDQANCPAGIYPDTCFLSCPCMPVAPFVQIIQHVEASQSVTTLLPLTLRIHVTLSPCDADIARRGKKLYFRTLFCVIT